MNSKIFQDARQRGVTHIGLVWYEPADFEAAMAIMKDRQNLFIAYADWLAASLKTESNARSAGLIPVRAMLRADAFISYCNANRLSVDASGRNHFASWTAYKHQSGGEH